MKVYRYNENLIQLSKYGMFNCFLVREVDGFTLVDSALSGCGAAIVAAAERAGAPIQRIVLTHAHADHAGALDEITARLTGIEVAMSARSAAFLRGEIALEAHEPDAKIRGSFYRRSSRVTRILDEGDRVESLQVIRAPGHAPDQLAFFDRRDGTLFAGDAFQTQAGIAVAGTLRWLFPFPALATWHKPTAIDSAKRLRLLNPTRLAVGHGPILEEPCVAMDAAIETALTRNGRDREWAI